MKLKIYLRGLGIGIVVTTLILGISYGGKKEMSDAEVIARAKKLGMVEAEVESGRLSEGAGAKEKETVMSDIEELSSEEISSEEIPSNSLSSNEGTSDEEESELSEEETLQQESELSEKETLQQESESAAEAVKQSDDTGIAEPIDSGIETSEQTVEVTIVSGDDSAAASRRIYEAGLVESATDLDKYLCSNGYSKKVVSGTYKIPVGADNETIAKIITKNR